MADYSVTFARSVRKELEKMPAAVAQRYRAYRRVNEESEAFGRGETARQQEPLENTHWQIIVQSTASMIPIV
jgi:mRNA-degrading endonuclease RelE of RelBE toxin-antitoxin system